MDESTATTVPETPAPPKFVLPDPLPKVFEIPEHALADKDVEKQLDDAMYAVLHNVDFDRQRHYYAIKGKEHAACNGRGKMTLTGADENAGKQRVCACAHSALETYLMAARAEVTPKVEALKPTSDSKETERLKRVTVKLDEEIAEVNAKKTKALAEHLVNKAAAEETVANAAERRARLDVRVRTLETIVSDARENIAVLQANIKIQQDIINLTTESLSKVNTEDRPNIENDVKKAEEALMFVANAVEKITKKYEDKLQPLQERRTRIRRKLPKE